MSEHSRRQPAFLSFLPDWLAWAESEWTDSSDGQGFWGVEGGSSLAYYGQGAYLAAATLAVESGVGEGDARLPGRAGLIERALASYRRIFSRHVGRHGQSEGAWGRYWGSPSLVERLACFVHLLRPHMSEADLALWRDMLSDEADCHAAEPVETNRFCAHGETHGERNYWRGLLLFRAAAELSDDPRSDGWYRKGLEYCVNAVSVPGDAESEDRVDGAPIRDLFRGANVHPEFVFEHHGAVSVDYSLHVLAFHVMATLSARLAGRSLPEAASHHIADLWRVAREFILPNGRIAFVGGVCRPRYMLSQAYLLPVLLYFGSLHRDDRALALAPRVAEILSRDRARSADGSFFSARGEGVRRFAAEHAPHYPYRLEADAVIAHGVAWLMGERADLARPAGGGDVPAPGPSFTVASPDAGIVVHRNAHGLFSAYWKRLGHAEADPPMLLCVPSANPDRVDWLSNGATVFKAFRPKRDVTRATCATFANGFAVGARIREGLRLNSDDGWGWTFDQQVVLALLPDGKTLLRMERTRARAEADLYEVAGLNLNLAKDVFCETPITLNSAEGEERVPGLGGEDRLFALRTSWVNVSGELGVVALYGPEAFTYEQHGVRRRQYATLLVDRLYYPLLREHRRVAPGETLVDTAVLLRPNDAAQVTREIAEGLGFERHAEGDVEALSWDLPALGRVLVAVNLGQKAAEFTPPPAMRQWTNAPVEADDRRPALGPTEVAVFSERNGEG